MKRKTLLFGIALLAIVISVPCTKDPLAQGPVVITLDNTQRYQTWEGWEATIPNAHRDENPLGDLDQHPVPQQLIDEMLDDAVDNLGLTALDLGLPIMYSRDRPGVEPVNDNDDPFVLDDSKIRWHWFDPYVRSVLIPFKQRVEARGDKFTLTLRPIAWNAWHWDEPASDPGQEYAEIVMAALDRLINNYGTTPDYVTIYNEPDNGPEGPDIVIRGMGKLAARMEAAGHTATMLAFPEASTVSASLSWFDHLVSTEPGLLPKVGRFSFHGYGGFSPSTLNAIRSRAEQHGMTTAQTEWWGTSNHPPDIFTCMREADVVLYQPYVLYTPSNDPSRRGLYAITYSGGTFPLFDYTGWMRTADWYDIYHYAAFIRPGDVRIEAVSQDSQIQPVAFEKPDGRQTVVVINSTSSAEDISIHALAPGTYGIVITSPGQPGEVQTPVTVGSGQPLSYTLPANSLATFYQQSSTPAAPASVAISGPAMGLVGVGYSFTATVSPVTATLPMTFAWQATEQSPVTHTSGLNDAVTFAWNLTGTKTITVTAMNTSGAVASTHLISIISGYKIYLPLILRSWS